MNRLDRFICDACLDRGWLILGGAEAAERIHVDVIPCPACRPEPSYWEQLLAPSLLLPILGWLSSWCSMNDRRSRQSAGGWRTRLLDRRQHCGPFRFFFIPVPDLFLRLMGRG